MVFTKRMNSGMHLGSDSDFATGLCAKEMNIQKCQNRLEQILFPLSPAV